MPTGLAFPHAYLAIQLTPPTPLTDQPQWHTETVYAITDMTWSEIRADRITEAIRGHWSIEVRRDVALVE